MELSLEERGAYNTILDLIYSKGGQLLDDPGFICGWLRCDIRVWRRIKQALIDRKKIYIDGEFIKNRVADGVILRANSRPNRSVQVPDKLPPKSEGDLFKNNDLDKNNTQKTPDRLQNLESRTEKDRKKESPHKPPKISTPEIQMGFERLWNAYPGIGKDGLVGSGFKGSKQKARQVFESIIKKTDDFEIQMDHFLFGASQYEKYLAQAGYPSKHLQTWLNQACWLDDYQTSQTPTKGNQNGNAKQKHADQISTTLERIRRGEPVENPFGHLHGPESIREGG